MAERGNTEAFVTLATNDTYSLGCLVLGSSLRRAGTTRQLVIMVTTGVSPAMRAQLGNVFNEVVEVNMLDSKDPVNLKLLGRPDLNVTFTKLHCWRLTQFNKAVFMDADTLVLQNVDDLFDREELSASPDAGWPDCFNSGVFVFKPCLETYRSILNFATSQGSFDGGDQGLLNMYFSDWATKDIARHLPFTYNVVSQAFYSYLPAFTQFKDQVKIVHFIGATKPWHHTYNTATKVVTPLQGTGHSQEFLQVWWNVFMEDVQPVLDPALVTPQKEEFERFPILVEHTPCPPPDPVPVRESSPGETTVNMVYPFVPPLIEDVHYTVNTAGLSEHPSESVEVPVMPRAYTHLEASYAEEPLSGIDPESPPLSMYESSKVVTGWTKANVKIPCTLSERLVEDAHHEGRPKSTEAAGAHSETVSEGNAGRQENPKVLIVSEEKGSGDRADIKSTEGETSGCEGCSNTDNKAEIELVGSLAQLSLQGGDFATGGGDSSPPLSDQERKLNWEKGQIDYLGQDAFTNIQKKLEESLSSEAKAPTASTATTMPTTTTKKTTVTSISISTVSTSKSSKK